MTSYVFIHAITVALEWAFGIFCLWLLLLYAAYKRPHSFIGGLFYKYLPSTLKERSRRKAGETPKRQVLAAMVPGCVITQLGDSYTVVMNGLGTAMVFFNGGAWQESKKKFFVAACRSYVGNIASLLVELPKTNMGTPAMFLFQRADSSSFSEALGELRSEENDAPISQFLLVEPKGQTYSCDLPGLGPVTLLDGNRMAVRPTADYDTSGDDFGTMSTPDAPEEIYTVLMSMKGGQYALFVSYETGPRQYTCELWIGVTVDVNSNTFDILPVAEQ